MCFKHFKLAVTSEDDPNFQNNKLFCILSEVFFLFGVARGLQWSTGFGGVSEWFRLP